MYALGWSAVGAAIGFLAYETLVAAVAGGLIGLFGYKLIQTVAILFLATRR